MPDRDYYIRDDAKTEATRAEFLRHIEKLMTLAGSASAAAEARTVLAFETTLARGGVEQRGPA